MNVLVLGHFYVELAGHRVAPRAAKQRQILATLAARADDVVSTDEVCPELWGSTAPPTAATTIHVYVSQIRKSPGRAGGGAYDPKDVLRTTRGGSGRAGRSRPVTGPGGSPRTRRAGGLSACWT